MSQLLSPNPPLLGRAAKTSQWAGARGFALDCCRPSQAIRQQNQLDTQTSASHRKGALDKARLSGSPRVLDTVRSVVPAPSAPAFVSWHVCNLTPNGTQFTRQTLHRHSARPKVSRLKQFQRAFADWQRVRRKAQSIQALASAQHRCVDERVHR